MKDRIINYIGGGIVILLLEAVLIFCSMIHFHEENHKLSRMMKSERIKQYIECVQTYYPTLRPYLFGTWIDEDTGTTFTVDGTDAAKRCSKQFLVETD